MDHFLIEGGNPLQGELCLQGAKNSVLALLCATILAEEPCEIVRCPRLSDVEHALAILSHLGCDVVREGDMVRVDARSMQRHDIPKELMERMRSSVIFLGPVLARTGRAEMTLPGGCELGPRPVDLHLMALRQLGADLVQTGSLIEGKCKNLHGGLIQLPFPSVGATENALLASVRADGVTLLCNAAREPEIVDLVHMLRAMGADIEGEGSGTITVRGVKKLKGIRYSVMPDRIAAATYLAAAAITGGDVTLLQARPQDLLAVLDVLEQAGCEITKHENSLRLVRSGPLYAVRTVRTMPHPGFPTDAQAPLMATMCVAKGTTVFVETVFQNRYKHIDALRAMGADLFIEGTAAVVRGVEELVAAQVRSTDLRGGAAVCLAALCARGRSQIEQVEHIDRGYEDFEGNLSALGASIQRIKACQTNE